MFSLPATLPTEPPKRPNIVLIYTDDVGYGDLSCYGAQRVRTPNIDSIAKNGIRFTDAHSPAAVCTPSRFSLLTGMYAWRNPEANHVINGDAPMSLPDDRPTLAGWLQKAGYTTGVVGKWHLGLGEGKPDYNQKLVPGPNDRGFDRSFVFPATNDRVPCVYIDDGRVVNLDPSDPISFDYQKKVGADPTGQERPDLLRVKPVDGHLGTIVNGVSRIGFMSGGNKARWDDERMSDLWAEKAQEFIRGNRKHPFFLYLAPHQVHVPQLPHPRFVGKSDCGLRGDTLLELDNLVGTVLKTLRDCGLENDTLVIFTSDNGGAATDGYSDPRDGLKDHRVNGPLRGEKYSFYEGGHRIPMVASWPKGIQPGMTSDALISHVDLLASLCRIAGQDLPTSMAGDSLDLSAALLGLTKEGRRELVYHRGGLGRIALREGPLTLIPAGPGKYELYNVGVDLAQTNDLADQRPSIVKAMAAKLDAYRAQTAQ